MMPFSLICRVLIEGNGDGPFVGIGSCSFVKTDLKWSLRHLLCHGWLLVLFRFCHVAMDGFSYQVSIVFMKEAPI